MSVPIPDFLLFLPTHAINIDDKNIHVWKMKVY
jgi:hypothetical protein